MNCLHLTGYGIKLKVSKLKAKSQLEITNGRDSIKDNQTNYVFSPRKIPYDTIIIDGYSGYVSLQAFHWLSKNNIPVFVLDFDGTILSSILPRARSTVNWNYEYSPTTNKLYLYRNLVD